MPFSLKTVEDLAEVQDMTVAEAKKHLQKLNVPVIGGYYDQGSLDAIQSEPKGTNIGKKAKNFWTLAPTDGVGAFKACLDKVDLDMTRHLNRRGNWLWVRNARKHRREIKVYTTSRASGSWKTSTFSMRRLSIMT